MQYRDQFKNRLNQLRSENRYRNFVELERHAGRHPHATWNSPSGPQDVVIWCSNDYLGMGQHPAVLDAMQSAIAQSGSGAGGTRNISGTSTAIVELEKALAALHNKPRALVLTSGYVANEASISALAGLLDDVVIFSDEMNHASIISGIRYARCEKVIFRHNDCAHLETLLKAKPIDRPKIIIFESVYAEFKKRLLAATKKLSIGPNDGDDLGPVINERQLNSMLAAINAAKTAGVSLLIGGARLETKEYKNGFYMQPTLLEGVKPEDDISQNELFGPIAILYSVNNFQEALQLANNSPYGLTACIHTQNYHRAMEFCHKIKCGATVVNAGTYGSEPHMPFGGMRQSGNGSREPGTEALDIYSELKDIYMIVDPSQV